jgi:urate oxidase
LAPQLCGDVHRGHLVAPNIHHLPVDLTAFGLDDRHEILVATSEPYGLIEATVERS